MTRNRNSDLCMRRLQIWRCYQIRYICFVTPWLFKYWKHVWTFAPWSWIAGTPSSVRDTSQRLHSPGGRERRIKFLVGVKLFLIGLSSVWQFIVFRCHQIPGQVRIFGGAVKRGGKKFRGSQLSVYLEYVLFIKFNFRVQYLVVNHA